MYGRGGGFRRTSSSKLGPEHAALEQRQVERALREAETLFPRPKMIVFCAFTFDPEAAKDIDALRGIVALKAQMNTDLLTQDLKKARSSNQSFWLMGQPDVELRKQKNGNTWSRLTVLIISTHPKANSSRVAKAKSRCGRWTRTTITALCFRASFSSR